MFLKCHPRVKDGKEHRYWSVVENRQWGACWLACYLYEQLELDEFWAGSQGLAA
jgi:hypothetical protein